MPIWSQQTGGQTTVEAAYLIPVLLLLLLLLIQPMILLYNRMVMENAAAEGCRLLATATSQGSYSQMKYEEYIKRRLAAIPPVDLFHLHTGDRTWEIALEGDESTTEVSVHITNRLRPLPLLGWGAELLRMTDAQHNIVQEVRVTMPTQPDWVARSGGNDPEGWVYAYD
ncbi:MAG: pilus assembly protein [Coriobacteriales bacterium]|nr:pilus assembly protein [Coriobacteriales bacterium]